MPPDGEPFEEKMRRLTATLREQQAEAAKLDADLPKAPFSRRGMLARVTSAGMEDRHAGTGAIGD